ncbi:MAG: hypothetical protein ACRDHY_08860 [Anaerolineales bacterium]
MAITKDVGRQTPLAAQIDFTFLTLETDAGAASGGIRTALVLPAFDIPPNAVVVGGEVVITTAFAGATVGVIDVGDGGSTTRYATNVNLLAAARTALTITGFKYSEWDTIDFVVDTTVAACSAGAGYVRLQYVTVGRVTENV